MQTHDRKSYNMAYPVTKNLALYLGKLYFNVSSFVGFLKIVRRGFAGSLASLHAAPVPQSAASGAGHQ